MRILFVEDNHNAARAAKVMLELHGYSVDLAFSVEEANTQIAANKYDLLISDLALPDGSGADLVSAANIPAIALSGYVTPSDREEALANGFSTFFAKPYNMNEVIVEIERLTTP